MTSSSSSAGKGADVLELLWEASGKFAYPLSVVEQVGLGRLLGAGPEQLKLDDILEAFNSLGLRRPPAPMQRWISRRLGTIQAAPQFVQVLVDYRAFAIRNLSAQFGGRIRGNEEDLRNNLLTYLPQRGYAEARTGRGRTDILLPSIGVLIEVKVWVDLLTYRNGLEELRRYIHTERPAEAFIVLFCNRHPLPPIIPAHREPFAHNQMLEGLSVPTLVIPFEVDPPSKAATVARRRARGPE